MFEKLKYFSTIFFGTFIIAVGVYFFMNPNQKYLRTRRGSRKLCPTVPLRDDTVLKHHLHHFSVPLCG